MKMKILITGAGGFIGSHLTESLLEKGYDVKVFIHYNSFNSYGWIDSFNSETKKSIEIFAGDVRDPHGVKKSMHGCDMVFHLAALIGIPYSYHSPSSYVDTNVKGTLNVLQAARELNVKKVIHTSTSEVYGTASFVPITENHPLVGQSPYSASKISADQIAMSYYYSFETPVIIVRPFNTYGPRQSARAVIPTIILQIAAGKKRIKLGSIHPTRDFNYVQDTVRGFIAASESKNAIGEVINIGSNYEISVKDTVKIISDLMDTNIDIESDENRVRPVKSEVDRLWADNSKAKRLIGWSPLYCGVQGFKRGLKETIRFFEKSNIEKYKVDTYNV